MQIHKDHIFYICVAHFVHLRSVPLLFLLIQNFCKFRFFSVCRIILSTTFGQVYGDTQEEQLPI